MRRLVPLAAAVGAAAVLTGSITAPAGPGGLSAQPGHHAASVVYRPPVDAPVADPFRAPPNPFAPGNRGIEYATAPGSPVRAAAGGVVVFAGRVGGALHVVVRHDDGIRTTYGFLASASVRVNHAVRAGDVLGTAGSRFHFGARRGDDYIDPAGLFGGAPPRVRLVPVDG